jgi:hypothetical protein
MLCILERVDVCPWPRIEGLHAGRLGGALAEPDEDPGLLLPLGLLLLRPLLVLFLLRVQQRLAMAGMTPKINSSADYYSDSALKS